jgi:deoxyadenosine/deoxycytidine kinase
MSDKKLNVSDTEYKTLGQSIFEDYTIYNKDDYTRTTIDIKYIQDYLDEMQKGIE